MNVFQFQFVSSFTSLYILKAISMIQQQKMSRSKRASTLQSSEDNIWSEQHQVYYYSNFQLFDSKQIQEEFYQFTIFLEKVSTELGRQWRNEANRLYCPYFTNREVFMNLMELWLSHHPPVNSHNGSKVKSTVFNSTYLHEFTEKMDKQVQKKHPEIRFQVPSTSTKAVCLGFFMTANQIWEDMFQFESLPKKMPVFSANNFMKQVATSLQKTFRPLMVVTQKISSVFGRKKRKYNEDISIQESSQKKFENCYYQFRKTLDIEKQLERKMSDLIIEEEQNQKNKVIEKTTFSEADSPIQTSLIGNLYSYVSDFLNRNPSWQVASNFVTQILDLNQIQMDEGKKVKVMRPAQDFYRKLVMVWLMAQKDSSQPVTFPIYLTMLKTTFLSNNWDEKYIVPTKYFFQCMQKDWELIKQQTNPTLLSEKDILNAFIHRIRNSMHKEWENKIKMREQTKKYRNSME